MLKDLIEKRQRLIGEIRTVLEEINKAPSAELESKLETLEADEEKVFKQIERESRQLERERSKQAPVNDPINSRADTLSDKDEDQKELRAEQFREYLKRGKEVLFEKRYNGLVSNNLTEGGSFIAPEEFVSQVIKAVDDAVVIRELATKFTLTQSVSLGVPTLDTDVSDADWTAEIETVSADSSLKTGKREFKPNQLAKLVLASQKLIRSSAVPVEAFLAQRLGYKFGLTLEKAYLTGTGANQPLGLFTASDSGISTSRDVSTDNTSSAITIDGLINALYSLKEQYQSRATWLFHRDAVKMLRKLKDSQNQYLWQPAVIAGQPDTLLGKPLRQSESVPRTFSTGAYVGLVGDFSNYWIVDVLSLQVQKLEELYALKNQVGWIGRLESDGAPVLQEAFARVKLA